jgi:hypothetical protein
MAQVDPSTRSGLDHRRRRGHVMELSGEQGLDGDNLLLAAGAICKRDLTSVRMHGEMRGVHPEPREFGGPPPTGTVTVVPAEGKKAQANEAKVTERGNLPE